MTKACGGVCQSRFSIVTMWAAAIASTIRYGTAEQLRIQHPPLQGNA